MIRGTVNHRQEAIVLLTVRGPTGKQTNIQAIVDSGHTGSLTLPLSIVTELELVRRSTGSAMLADGSIRPFDLYAAEVLWDGNWRAVLVSLVGNEALLGMRLLIGHQLRIEVVAGGAVEISPLKP